MVSFWRVDTDSALRRGVDRPPTGPIYVACSACSESVLDPKHQTGLVIGEAGVACIDVFVLSIKLLAI
jgi:hypothetical protein